MIKTFEEFNKISSLIDNLKDKARIIILDKMPSDEELRKYINLSDVPKKSLDKQFKKFKFIHINSFSSLLLKENKEKRLNEGIKFTYDIDNTCKEITKRYNLEDWQFNIIIAENDIKVALIIPNISNNKDIIISDMESLGYYVSDSWKERGDENDNNIYTIIRFDPRFPDNINNQVKNMGIIYHLTPEYNLESIKKSGFIPQNNNKKFKYPPRIHFLKGNINEKNIKSIGQQLCDENDDIRNNGEYILFTLDVDRIPNDVNFIGDSCYEYGICTEDVIPYDCVISKRNLKFKK